jgi:hypothetical protein
MDPKTLSALGALTYGRAGCTRQPVHASRTHVTFVRLCTPVHVLPVLGSIKMSQVSLDFTAADTAQRWLPPQSWGWPRACPAPQAYGPRGCAGLRRGRAQPIGVSLGVFNILYLWYFGRNACPNAIRLLLQYLTAGAFVNADQLALLQAQFLIGGATGIADPLAPPPVQSLVAGACVNAHKLIRQPAGYFPAGALAAFVVKGAVVCRDEVARTQTVLAEVATLAVLAVFQHAVATRCWRRL